MQQWRTSVVISARSGPEPVLSALRSLSRLPQFDQLEVVVANCCGAATERKIKSGFPGITVLTLPVRTSIGESRHVAIQRTSGDIVAVLHERYQVPPDWLDLMWRVHTAEMAEVVSGCVGPSSGMTPAQWAMFLSEYTCAAPPLPSGPLDRDAACMIPGGNVSYKRTAFQKASMAGRLWELDFHAALFDHNAHFYRGAQIIAEFAHPYTVREYIAERVEVSRAFASRRAAGRSVVWRLAIAGSRVALPALVMARVAGAVCRKRLYTGRFIVALPWIAAFSVLQAWGEIAGYLSAASCRDQSVSHQSAPGPEI
jgi:Glycosyl transferase family 2